MKEQHEAFLGKLSKIIHPLDWEVKETPSPGGTIKTTIFFSEPNEENYARLVKLVESHRNLKPERTSGGITIEIPKETITKYVMSEYKIKIK